MPVLKPIYYTILFLLLPISAWAQCGSFNSCVLARNMRYMITNDGVDKVFISFYPEVDYTEDGAQGGDQGATAWVGAVFMLKWPLGSNIQFSQGDLFNQNGFDFDPNFLRNTGSVLNGATSATILGVDPQPFYYELFTFTGNSNLSFVAGISKVVLEIRLDRGDPNLIELVPATDVVAQSPVVNGEPSITNGVWDEEFAGFFTPGVAPVEWLDFEALPMSKKAVKLKWATASELNNSHFNIQRSIDGKNFELVGKVKGNGTVTGDSEYEFRDFEVSGDQVFYRLKQVDFDGQFDYSKIIEVDWSSASRFLEPVIEFFPNPAKEDISFRLLSELSGTHLLRINDYTGKILFELAIDNATTRVSVDLSSFTQGIYFASLVSIQDQKIYEVGKFLKE